MGYDAAMALSPKTPSPKVLRISPEVQFAKGLQEAMRTANCLQLGLSKDTLTKIKIPDFGLELKAITPDLRINFGKFESAVAGLRKALNQSFGGTDISALNKWSERIKTLPSFPLPRWDEIEKMQARCSHELGIRGWFLSVWASPLSYFPELLSLIESDRWNTAEEALTRHFEEIAPDIEKRLVADFPHREAVLKEAFSLHREGRFFGSVALLLSQSEGIGRDIFNASPVSRGKAARSKIKSYLEKHDRSSGLTALLNVIFDDLPIHRDSKQLQPDGGDLNRHAVLHGQSANFGTRQNSIKAISWIEFVASFNFWNFRGE